MNSVYPNQLILFHVFQNVALLTLTIVINRISVYVISSGAVQAFSKMFPQSKNEVTDICIFGGEAGISFLYFYIDLK